MSSDLAVSVNYGDDVHPNPTTRDTSGTVSLVIHNTNDDEIPEGELKVAVSSPPGVTVSMAGAIVVEPNVWAVDTCVHEGAVLSLPVAIRDADFPMPDSPRPIQVSVSRGEELKGTGEIGLVETE